MNIKVITGFGNIGNSGFGKIENEGTLADFAGVTLGSKRREGSPALPRSGTGR